jgi:hypothetical protein
LPMSGIERLRVQISTTRPLFVLVRAHFESGARVAHQALSD